MNYKVNGIGKIQEYFKGYEDSYCIIGGTACYLNFHKLGLDFRATKDIALVVITNNNDEVFIKHLIRLIDDGEYTCKEKSDDNPQLYRFTNPQNSDFPFMIELFCEKNLKIDGHIGKIDIENEMSLSGILLNSDYYNLLVENVSQVDGVSVASIASIIMLKIHAWINLHESGNSTDVRNSKKHYNDIFKLAETILKSDTIHLVESIKGEFTYFVSVNENDFNLEEQEMVNVLKNVFS